MQNKVKNKNAKNKSKKRFIVHGVAFLLAKISAKGVDRDVKYCIY